MYIHMFTGFIYMCLCVYTHAHREYIFSALCLNNHTTKLNMINLKDESILHYKRVRQLTLYDSKA